MKNIILIDPALIYLDSFMSFKDVYLATLVPDHLYVQSDLCSKYPERIYSVFPRIPDSREHFFSLCKNDYNLTDEDIKKYSTAQLKVERFLQRAVLDMNEIQYRYMTALSYWLGIFSKHKIDLLFGVGLEHGALYDSIPIEIAKANNIPVILLEPMLDNFKTLAHNLRCLNTGKLFKLSSILDKYTPPTLSNYVSQFQPATGINLKKDTLCEKIKKKLKLDRNIQIYTKHFKKSFCKNTNVYEDHTPVSKEIETNLKYMKKLESVYRDISIVPNFEEKYIFYALHMEPEASIMCREAFSNQLQNIKMLADNLPEGWKLYVKEHPHTFTVFDKYSYFLRNIFIFKTEQFYRNILDCKNTILIRYEVPGAMLIDKAQAISTICGTIILESMLKKKPVLIFGNLSTVFAEVTQAFNIHSQNDVKEAMRIISEGFSPDYSNLNEVVEDYMFETICGEALNFDSSKLMINALLEYKLPKKKFFTGWRRRGS